MKLDELMSKTPSELDHYGVPGMKWGRRKSGSTSTKGSTRSKVKETAAKVKKAVKMTPQKKATVRKLIDQYADLYVAKAEYNRAKREVAARKEREANKNN